MVLILKKSNFLFLTLNHPQGRASPAVAIQVALEDHLRPPDGTNMPPDILNIPPVWLKVPPDRLTLPPDELMCHLMG